MMHRTVLDNRDAEQLPYLYLNPKEVSVKVVGAPRWTWMWEVLAKLPEGKCIMFPMPEGMPSCAYFSGLIRAAIGQSNHTLQWHWSVRQSRDEKSIVVAKGPKWSSAIERAEVVDRELKGYKR